MPKEWSLGGFLLILISDLSVRLGLCSSAFGISVEIASSACWQANAFMRTHPPAPLTSVGARN